MRIGILGGTFDPIHLGHLRLAEEVGDDLRLESIYLIPASHPPHKEKRSVSSFAHRFAMTELAACESPLFKASDMEGRREGISYSIDTLREFHRMFEGLQLYFIMGLDAFLEIDTWREYRQLFHYAHFVVIQRPGLPSEEIEPYLLSLEVGYRKTGEKGSFEIPGGHTVIYRKATLMEISSTDVRRRVANGRSIRFLVPEAVRSYIMDKGLYSDDGSTR
ncbi:MAG: nicotinate-nucleotide adenylyltransferase [Desulfobacteraceae bacterium]|nr:MAG: nicotinate-nucleotide adenylyltransferase [Desulfobacteraceae bacterium]